MKNRFVALFVCVLLVLGAFPITAESTDITISLADLGENAEIHTALQQKYLDDSTEHVSPYARGTAELSNPEPVVFKWDSNADVGAVYQLSVSENADMSMPRRFSVAGTKYEVYNFRPDTRYYWTVSTAGVTSKVATFKTENELPYNICVDGVTTVRDCGGWSTSDGGRVRFGMMYRCGKLHENGDEFIPLISKKGIKTMHDELGIKTEIDLRGEYYGPQKSALGDDVKYCQTPMEYTNTVLEDINYASLREIFAVLAEESS